MNNSFVVIEFSQRIFVIKNCEYFQPSHQNSMDMNINNCLLENFYLFIILIFIFNLIEFYHFCTDLKFHHLIVPNEKEISTLFENVRPLILTAL
ncbi:hypothetical protein BpHYR1_031091 [Brachionus plicatilis]|uniref:Uncharacterized protein n=1 Tax=Brachionus plicatilis TaxID=10195 RepID=A0A3M7RHX7_BRAPC|nr:hypothetical protein BpHYR1_031091 [Brachionus plicatilis]